MKNNIEGHYFHINSNFQECNMVAARHIPKRNLILGYFFRKEATLTPESAFTVMLLSDMDVLAGKWPVIGHIDSFERSDWRVPKFYRHDVLDNSIVFETTYDDDLNFVKEERVSTAAAGPRDVQMGSDAVISELNRLLA